MGRFFGVLARESTPGPLKTGSAKKWCRIHTKSAPETNSKAISLWAREGVCFRTHPPWDRLGGLPTRALLRGQKRPKNSNGPALKRGGKKGVKITIFGSLKRTPGALLKVPGPGAPREDAGGVDEGGPFKPLLNPF